MAEKEKEFTVKEWDRKMCVVCESKDIRVCNPEETFYECNNCKKYYFLKTITLNIITGTS